MGTWFGSLVYNDDITSKKKKKENKPVLKMSMQPFWNVTNYSNRLYLVFYVLVGFEILSFTFS